MELVEWYIPPLPEVQDYNEKVADQEGELDFGMTYGPRVIQLTFFITNKTSLGYYEKIAAAASMFNPKKGDQVITFDEELAGKRYIARAMGTVPIEKGSVVRTLVIPLKMHDPFPEGDEQITESTITASQGTIQIDSVGTTEAPLVMIIINTGVTTINGFTITNEIEVE